MPYEHTLCQANIDTERTQLVKGDEQIAYYDRVLEPDLAARELVWIKQRSKFGFRSHTKAKARNKLFRKNFETEVRVAIPKGATIEGSLFGEKLKPGEVVKLTFDDKAWPYGLPTTYSAILDSIQTSDKARDITDLAIDEALFPLGDGKLRNLSCEKYKGDCLRNFSWFMNDQGKLVAYAFDQRNPGSKHMDRGHWAGTLGRFVDGAWRVLRAASSAEAKELEPYWHAIYMTHRNTWVKDLPDASLHDAEMEAEVLEKCRKLIAPVEGYHVSAVVPRQLRYVSDGSPGSQTDYAFYCHETSYAGPFDGSLQDLVLLVKPAWLVCLSIDGGHLSGNVFVDSDAAFICSDWCMRETTDKSGGIDLYTGLNNKHTLLSWCAGPCADLVEGNNVVLARKHIARQKSPKLRCLQRSSDIRARAAIGSNLRDNFEETVSKEIARSKERRLRAELLTPSKPALTSDALEKHMKIGSVLTDTRYVFLPSANRAGYWKASARTYGSPVCVYVPRESLRQYTQPLHALPVATQDAQILKKAVINSEYDAHLTLRTTYGPPLEPLADEMRWRIAK